jgi:hypothetical protein
VLRPRRAPLPTRAINRHSIDDGHRVRSTEVLGGLHHEDFWNQSQREFLRTTGRLSWPNHQVFAGSAYGSDFEDEDRSQHSRHASRRSRIADNRLAAGSVRDFGSLIEERVTAVSLPLNTCRPPPFPESRRFITAQRWGATGTSQTANTSHAFHSRR